MDPLTLEPRHVSPFHGILYEEMGWDFLVMGLISASLGKSTMDRFDVCQFSLWGEEGRWWMGRGVRREKWG